MPIEEYTKASNAKENVNISVVSRQCDAAGAGLFGTGNERTDMFCDDAEESEYAMDCRGTLEIRGGRLYLSYSEPQTDGEDVCDTEISFDIADPDCVTVTRSGGVSASFVLRAGSRGISVYKTPFGPIEMCVLAKKISNTMNINGGVISMDYTVELKGMTAQRTRITVSAEPIG